MAETKGHATTTALRTAIGYIRVSSDRDRKHKLQSPELQRQRIKRYARQHGIEIVGWYEDRNRSGGTLTRAGLLEALGRVRGGEAEGLLVARANRASRDALDGLQLLRDVDRMGGFVLAADGSIDTTTPQGRQMTTNNFAQGQRELEDAREQAEIVHDAAIYDKRRHMGHAAFGFTRTPKAAEDASDEAKDAASRLVVDEARKPALVEIFERRAAGQGYSQIARAMDDAGVRDARGARLTPNRIRDIIRNRAYLGEARHGDRTVPGAHDALINKTLFLAANGVAPATASVKRGRSDDVLVGLVRCAGCSMGASSSRSRPSAPFVRRCRTIGKGAQRTATHDCPEPMALTTAESRDLEGLVWARGVELARGAQAHHAGDDRDLDRERGEQMIEQAKADLDDLASLAVKRSLGERWAPMVAEAEEQLRAGEALVARARPDRSDRDAKHADVLLEAVADDLSPEERRDALRGVVQAVFIRAGDAPLAERIDVVGHEVDLGPLSRPGVSAEPRRWPGL